MVSRDPQLHKFSNQGFFAKMHADPKDTTIRLNPLVYKGLNADNDGDQLNFTVPAGEEARKEIIEKALPSKNLLSHRNFLPMFVPSNESALGLFLASTEASGKKAKVFKNQQDVVDAWKRGELHHSDEIEITK